jgi:hypothetical protein
MAIQPVVSQINIGGRLLSTMPAAIRGAQLQLTALRSSVIRTNTTLMGLGKGLLGFGASFLAFEGVKSFLKTSIDLAKEEKGTHAALLLTITNQNKLRGIGVEQSKAQVEAIENANKALENQTGFSHKLFDTYAKTLNMYRMTPKYIQQAMPALADLVAYQKKAGMDVTANADAFGKAMLGFPKALKAIGIEWNKIQLANFMKMDDIHKFQALISGMENAYGGAATHQDPLVKAANLAQIHWDETMAKIGDSWLPIMRKLTVFFGSIADIISPPLIKLSEFIAANFDSWVAVINKSVIPVLQKLVKDGWDFLSKGIDLFKKNSTWLVPFIGEAVKWIGIWTFVIGPLIAVIKDLQLVLVALTASNPWLLLATAAAIGAVYTIQNWEKVKHWFLDFAEWLGGTELMNPHNQAAKQMNWFPKGTVPRALPAQPGIFNTMVDAATDAMFGKRNGSKNGLGRDEPEWSKAVKSWWSGFTTWIEPAALKLWQDMVKDCQDIWRDVGAWFGTNVWNPMIQGMVTVKDAIWKWLISPITDLNEKWQAFLKSIGMTGPVTTDNPLLQRRSNLPSERSPQFQQTPWASMDPLAPPQGSGRYWNGLYTSGWYGRKFGEYNRDANMGPRSNLLGKGGIAVSPDSGYRLGEYVDIIDSKTGQVIRRNELVNDWSFRAPRVPNHHMFELNNDKIKQDKAILRRSLIQAPLPKDQSSRGDIHLHYDAGGIHIHGSEDLNSRFAEHHRRAVEKFREMMAEAIQQNHRARFA